MEKKNSNNSSKRGRKNGNFSTFRGSNTTQNYRNISKFATLKVNQKLSIQQFTDEAVKMIKKKKKLDFLDQSHFDPNIKTRKLEKRYKNGLKFVNPGYYSKNKNGDTDNRDQISFVLDSISNKKKFASIVLSQTELEQKMAKYGCDLSLANTKQKIEYLDSLIDDSIEYDREKYCYWWEIGLLESTTIEKLISDTIENFENKRTGCSPVIIESYLTPKEKIRIRKQKKAEKIQETREKIIMGLLPPEKPKVKLSNLIRVVGMSLTANPSEVEKKVREEIHERQRKHFEINEKRKLTPEQKRQKKISGWLEEEKKPVCAVFLINQISEMKIFYKIDINAKEYHLVGGFISCLDGITIVVVQGGPRAVSKYKNLMLNRIKWEESNRSIDNHYCHLVYNGIISAKMYDKWSVIRVNNENEILNDFGIYYIMAKNFIGSI